jgi:peptide/nickel transport system substrate-binding protein
LKGPVLPYSWAFNSQIQHITNNKKMAIERLEEAGWKDDDDDGILEKMIGNKKYKLEFELLVNTDNGARYQAATLIEKALKDLGISVKLVNVSWDELRAKVMSKKYDTAIMGWKLAPNPDLRFMFAGSEIKSGYNFVSYSNPELDEILIRAQTDDKGRKELLYKAQEIINQDIPYVFLYSPNKLLALSTKLKGLKPDPVNLFNNINEWWVDE